jgi:hypothetical protein
MKIPRPKWWADAAVGKMAVSSLEEAQSLITGVLPAAVRPQCSKQEVVTDGNEFLHSLRE